MKSGTGLQKKRKPTACLSMLSSGFTQEEARSSLAHMEVSAC